MKAMIYKDAFDIDLLWNRSILRADMSCDTSWKVANSARIFPTTGASLKPCPEIKKREGNISVNE